ncbi:hypothetical protein ACNFR7_08550 [Streptomyces sp. RM1]
MASSSGQRIADTGDGGGPFRWDRAVRGVLAGLLRLDIKTSDRQPWSVYVDLDEVRVLDATPWTQSWT